jgi:hypothetical protein
MTRTSGRRHRRAHFVGDPGGAEQFAPAPEIMDCGQSLDLRLGLLWQRIIDRARVDEVGVAADRRDNMTEQERPFGRQRVERTVGVKALGRLAQPS